MVNFPTHGSYVSGESAIRQKSGDQSDRGDHQNHVQYVWRSGKCEKDQRLCFCSFQGKGGGDEGLHKFTILQRLCSKLVIYVRIDF